MSIEHARCCPPWKCFFCGEVFRDAVTAGRHFGEHEGCEYPVPGCVDPLRQDEKARLHAVEIANYEAKKACDERDAAQEDADAYRAQPAEIERLFGKGVRSLHQAYLVLDAMEGRALAAEERLRAAQFTEEACPGHVASPGDPKVCARCGVHIDTFRPDDDDAGPLIDVQRGKAGR
jgi:hypothetical protein